MPPTQDKYTNFKHKILIQIFRITLQINKDFLWSTDHNVTSSFHSVLSWPTKDRLSTDLSATDCCDKVSTFYAGHQNKTRRPAHVKRKGWPRLTFESVSALYLSLLTIHEHIYIAACWAPLPPVRPPCCGVAAAAVRSRPQSRGSGPASASEWGPHPWAEARGRTALPVLVSDILGSEPSPSEPPAPGGSAPPPSETEPGIHPDGLQPSGQLLVRLYQYFNQILQHSYEWKVEIMKMINKREAFKKILAETF